VTALAHELAGLIGPLHGLVSEIPIVGGKNRAPLDLKRANADSAATADSTKRRAEKMKAALDATAARPGLCRAGASKSIARWCGVLLHPVRAVVAPRIEAVLHLALMVEVSESPVTERGDDHDSDDGGDIAAAARLRLVVLLVR
jgi:hypothetical protein